MSKMSRMSNSPSHFEFEFFDEETFYFHGLPQPAAIENLSSSPSTSITMLKRQRLFPETIHGRKNQIHFNNPKNSDVTIVCGPLRLPAHLIILASHTSLFADTLEKSDKENKTAKKGGQESAPVIEFQESEFTPEMIRRGIQWCYTGRYDGDTEPMEEDFDFEPEGEGIKRIKLVRSDQSDLEKPFLPVANKAVQKSSTSAPSTRLRGLVKHGSWEWILRNRILVFRYSMTLSS
ncbi:hypothetical protein EX30DRAFT_352055 [Ascodesmis nigricans]|uniref:BTB domain-containing protein n=1 Tax=Ascodesmis nigricans TaxID=341454 RepID=A0A4V3SHQ9_9PEZI|nr:hypothetical protein EX30DRAFT_352055 [Ascodesmis nigricans]